MKILIAVDGSPYTKQLLEYLASHEEWMSERHDYTVLHVVIAIPPHAASSIDKAELKAYYDAEADKVFKPIRAFFNRQKREASFIAKVGHAADVIAATATKSNFDLLVMGSHGHSSLGKLVMGSVTTKVMARCTTPVLLVR